MASITKQKTGWRVQISVKGTRDSSVLPTKAEAQAWAVEREAQMRRMVETGVATRAQAAHLPCWASCLAVLAFPQGQALRASGYAGAA